MNKKLLAVLVILMLVLGGCASSNDKAMVDSYMRASETHSTQQSAQVFSKASAIQEMIGVECDGTDPNCAVAKALGGVVGAMMISQIEAQEFTVKAPKTGVDAQMTLIKTAGQGIPYLTVGVVASKAIDQKQGDVDITQTGDGTITNSKREDHATNLGENGIATNQPSEDNSEVVFEPVEEEEEEE